MPSVGTAVGYLTLDVSNFVSGMETATRVASTAFQNMENTGKGRVQALGSALVASGSLLTATVTQPIISMGSSIISAGAQFEQTMDTITAVTQKPGQSLVDLEKNTERLREKALELGSSTFFSAQEVADGMIIMGKAGWDTEDIMEGMGGVLAATAASGENLNSVSEILVNSLTTMGEGAGEAARYADILTQAANAGTLNITDMGTSMKYIGPTARTMGFDFEEVAGALLLMSQSGIKGSQAGTSLNRVLTNLKHPVGQAADAFEALGMTTDEFINGDGSFKSLSEIMEILRGHFDGLTDAERSTYSQMLAGQVGMKGLDTILNATDEDLKGFIDQMYNSQGVAQQTADIMRDNLAGRLDQLGDSFENLKLVIHRALEPTLKSLAEWAAKVVQSFTEKLTPGMIKVGAAAAALAASLGPLMLVFGKILQADGLFNGLFSRLTSGFLTVGDSVKGFLSPVTSAFKLIQLNFKNLVPLAQYSAAGMISKFKSGISGIGKVFGNLSSVYKASTKDLGSSFFTAFTGIKSVASSLAKDITKPFRTIKNAYSSFNESFATFSNSGKVALTSVKRFASDVVGQIRVFGSNSAQAVGRVAEYVSKNSQSKLLSMFNGLRNGMGNFFKVFTKDLSGVEKGFSGIGQKVHGFIQPALKSVSDFVSNYTTALSGLPKTFSNKLVELKAGFANIGPQFASAVSDSLKKAFPTVAKGLQAYGNQIGKAINGEFAPRFATAISNAFEDSSLVIAQSFSVLKKEFSTLGPVLASQFEMVRMYAGRVMELFMPAIQSAFSAATQWMGVFGKSVGVLGNIFKVSFAGVAVAAIAAVIAAVVHLVATNEEFRERIGAVFGDIGNQLKTLGSAISDAFGRLGEAIGPLKEMFSAFESEVGEIIVQTFSQIWLNLVNLTNAINSLQFDSASESINRLREIINGVFSFGIGIVTILSGLLTGNLATAWDGVKQAAQAFWDVISNIAGLIDSAISTALNALADILRDLGFEETADAVQHLGDNFTLFSDIINTVKDAVSRFVQTAVDAFNNAKQAVSEFVNEHKAQLDQIGAALVNIAAVVGGVFKAAWTATFNTIAALVGQAIGVVASVLGGIGHTIMGIAGIITGLWNIVSNVVLAIISLLTGDLEGAFNHLGLAADGFGQLFTGIFDTLGGVVDTFVSLAGGAFDMLGTVIGGAGEFITGAVSNVAEWFGIGGDAATEMSGKIDVAMDTATGSIQAHEYAATTSYGNIRGEISETIGELDSATEQTQTDYTAQAEAAAQNASDTTSYLDEIMSKFGEYSDTANGELGDVSGFLGESGYDFSQYASGIGADTGIATASFEEMGAALDQLSAGSTQAAQVVSESFGNVASTVTESISQSTQGFTTFGETATTTFTQAATMVTEFANNTNQALSSFGVNAVAAFTNMTNGVTQALNGLPGQVALSLGQTSAVILQWAGQLFNALQQAFQGVVQITTASFSQFTQIVANAMNAATQSVNMFGAAVTAVGNAVQQSIGATFTVVAQVVASSCLQMINSVVNFTQTVNNAVTAMCAQLVARITAGFTSMSSTVRAQLNQMQAAVTQFGARATSIMTSAMSRCRSAVQSGMTAMNSTMRSQLSQMIAAVTQFGARAASTMKTAMTQILASVKSGCQQTTSELQRNTQQWLNALTRFAGEARQRAASAGQNIKSGLISSLNGLSSQMYSLGLQAANGMASGIRAGSGGVIAAMQSIANAAVAAAKNSLKVASPSKVMRDEVGYWLPAGIAEGISENADIVTYAMTDLAKNLIALSQDTTRDWTDESKKQLTAFGDTIKSSITKVGERLTKTWTDYFEQQLNENTDNQNAVYREMARIENEYHKRIEQAKDKNAKDAFEAERDRLLEAQEERLATLKSQREEIQKQYDETSKDVAKFGTDVIDKFSEAMSKVADDAATEITEKFQKISEAAQEALEEVNKKIETMTSKLQDYGELLTKQSDEETGDYWQLNSLQEQINALEKYGNNLEAIKGKVSETLLSEIVAMDVEQATHYTDLLLSLTDEKLSEYNALYERKQQLAADIANRFYADQIQQVKDNYLKELVNAYLETFEQIGEIGKDTAAAFMENFDMEGFSDEYKLLAAQFEKGIADELGNSDMFKSAAAKLTGNISETLAESFDGATQEIVRRLLGLNDDIADAVDLSDAGAEAGEEFAQALYVQTTEELGIHSPSTVFASLGQDTGQGFINGIMAVLTSGKPFEIFAEALKVALDEFVNTLQVSGTDEIMPKVAELVEKVRMEVIALITYLTDSIRLFFGDVKGMLSELLALVTSTLPQFLSFAQQLAAGNDSIASSARSAASALRDQAAAVRELAAAQAAAATSEGVSVTGGGTTGVPVGNVTNNYSTTINSPVKVSAVEAMQAANRNMRSLAEGF